MRAGIRRDGPLSEVTFDRPFIICIAVCVRVFALHTPNRFVRVRNGKCQVVLWDPGTMAGHINAKMMECDAKHTGQRCH